MPSGASLKVSTVGSFGLLPESLPRASDERLATFEVDAASAGIWTVKASLSGLVPVGFTEPSEHVMSPVELAAEHPLGGVETSVVPAASWSVTTTFVAVLVPGFVTVTVYVTRLFGETNETFAGECEMSRHSLEPHVSAELVAGNHANAQTIIASRQLRGLKRSSTGSRPCLRGRSGEGFRKGRP